MQIALLGLGKMGRMIVEKLLADGHHVVVWNRSKETLEQFRTEKGSFVVEGKLVIAHKIEDLREALPKPRVIWSMLPAGEATDTVLQELNAVVASGDCIIDGGNANYKDTQRRFDEYEKKGIKFLGVGVSGGVHALENGCCLMVGGNQMAYTYVTPILDSLVKPHSSHKYFGAGGAGHFVKMVHNGIEYGMMQSIAEGFGVLAKSEYKPNLFDVATVYQQGSIVASFLVQMVIDALSREGGLSNVAGVINATGEAKWTIEAAKEENVPVPVIEQSLAFREKSQYDSLISNTFVAKLVSAMRHEFGGHEVKSK